VSAAVDCGIVDRFAAPACCRTGVLAARLARLAAAATGHHAYGDEAQYWTWAENLDWGYYSKPPASRALIWVSTRLFGDGLIGVKALAMLCYPLAAAACWAIAARLYDRRTAFWSALAVLTLPIFSWLGLFVSTDALLTLCWTLALWAWLRALDTDRWRDWPAGRRRLRPRPALQVHDGRLSGQLSCISSSSNTGSSPRPSPGGGTAGAGAARPNLA
jgi:hypothetical protein